MTQWLRESTAATLVLGPMVDQTDGFTAETGLTITQADVRLSKGGGDFAQVSTTATLVHDEFGWYPCGLATTDTNTLGRLTVAVHESGARPVVRECMIVPANVWDSLFSTDKLEVDVTQISGDATAPANLELMYDGTGYAGGTQKIGVDVVKVSGDATAPANLEAMFDGTGYIGGSLKLRTDSSYATIEGSYTLKSLLRLMASVLFGKLSGGGTVTATFRDTADGTNRVVATIDADGNRTTVVLDAS